MPARGRATRAERAAAAAELKLRAEHDAALCPAQRSTARQSAHSTAKQSHNGPMACRPWVNEREFELDDTLSRPTVFPRTCAGKGMALSQQTNTLSQIFLRAKSFTNLCSFSLSWYLIWLHRENNF